MTDHSEWFPSGHCRADEYLKIALDKMASASDPPTLPHIRNVAGHALERINELEAEVDELRIKYDGRMAELRQVTQDARIGSASNTGYPRLIRAITSYRQADEDGVTVAVSREACDKAGAAIKDLVDACQDAISKIDDCAAGKINFRADFADRLRAAVAKAVGG